MTLIEFYDIAPIENIISSLTMQTDRVIFVGTGKRMERQGRGMQRFLDSRGINAEFRYVHINKHDLSGIVRTLESIIAEEYEIVVDLNGGEDLLLVAMGIVYERYKDTKRIEMHRYNIRNGTVSDCDGDGIVYPKEHFEITVRDNIDLHGGAVRYANAGSGRGTYSFDLSEQFKGDVLALWELCKASPAAWNRSIDILNETERRTKAAPEKLTIHVNTDAILGRKDGRERFKLLLTFLKDLKKSGCIAKLEYDETAITYEYKSLQLKQCVDKAGNVLELTTLILAMELRRKDGKPVFNDAMNGVCIDWDGDIHSGSDSAQDVENEIDVFLMKGLVPILISCKNGGVDSDELYKLRTVAGRFGGDYARRVLITTYISSSKRSREALRRRAKEMDIELIENVHLLSNEEFSKRLRAIGIRHFD